MRQDQRDALAVIDTAYGSAASEDEWMDALHEAIVKALGAQAVVALYDVHAAGYTMRNVRANEHRQFWVETSTSPPHLSQLHWVTVAPPRSSLATELAAVLGDAALTAWRSRERPQGVADLHYLAARKMVILSTAASRENAPNKMFGPWYASVTDHIVSAMRLRRTIGALPEHADLVLKCDGAPVHQSVAVRPDERDALTAAIGDVEAAHRRAYAGDGSGQRWSPGHGRSYNTSIPTHVASTWRCAIMTRGSILVRLRGESERLRGESRAARRTSRSRSIFTPRRAWWQRSSEMC